MSLVDEDVDWVAEVGSDVEQPFPSPVQISELEPERASPSSTLEMDHQAQSIPTGESKSAPSSSTSAKENRVIPVYMTPNLTPPSRRVSLSHSMSSQSSQTGRDRSRSVSPDPQPRRRRSRSPRVDTPLPSPRLRETTKKGWCYSFTFFGICERENCLFRHMKTRSERAEALSAMVQFSAKRPPCHMRLCNRFCSQPYYNYCSECYQLKKLLGRKTQVFLNRRDH